MHTFKKLLLVAPLLAASYTASAQSGASGVASLASITGLLSTNLSALPGISILNGFALSSLPTSSLGGISLNNLPLIGSALGAPGSQSIALANLPVLSIINTASKSVFPDLSGLPPGVGLIPVLGPLTGGSAVVSLGSFPLIGPLLFGGTGGNVLSLQGLSNGGLQTVIGDLTPTAGNQGLSLANLIPFQGGLLGQGSLVPPVFNSILVSYGIPAIVP